MKEQGMDTGMAVHVCNPSYSRGRGRKMESSMPAWAKLESTYLKNKNKNQRAGGTCQGVEHLSSMCEAFVLNPRYKKKKKV
jgi:hypothetical protein